MIKPAKTTTPVVPSPTSLSYDFESSTIKCAIGLTISIFSTIVEPSLVINTSPSGLTIILSIPLGPNELLKTVVIDNATLKFYLTASNPLIRFFFSYSLTIK